MLFFARINAEPAAGLPGGRTLFSVKVIHNDIDGAVTVIFNENAGEIIFGRGFTA